MPPTAAGPVSLLARALGAARLPALLVRTGPASTGDLPDDLPDDVPGDVREQLSVMRLGEERPEGQFASVVLVVDDVAALRDVVTRLDELDRARVVVVVVAASGRAIAPRTHPTWAVAVTDVEASVHAGGAITRVQLAARAPVAPIVLAVARGALAAGTPFGHGGLRVVVDDGDARPPADPTVLTAYDAEAKHPPDVLLTRADGPEPATTPVLGRPPAVVRVDPADPDGPDGPDGPGPLDEAVLNPRGFPRTPKGPWRDLTADDRLDLALVARLRPAPAVRVTWPVSERVVAGLAMAGVVLVSGPVPPSSRARLGDPLADALEAPADEAAMADEIRREERSVRLRRAAVLRHGTRAWRARLAARAGTRAAAEPSVSVLLPTRRPEQLDFALGQVARQHLTGPGGAPAALEVVLATHGFTPDAGRVRDLLGGLGGLAHRVVPVPGEAVLGEVLRAATDAASGDLVVKMDDDDWYAPDLLTDLLLARQHSGAEVVGSTGEIVYVESRDVTVRRRGPSENYGRFVAGGTLMIDRSLLRELGGFRPLRLHEDARLLGTVVRAGGSIYRVSGLGYVLRRRASGHTWEPGDDYFLRPDTVRDQWAGFRPSALMELT